MDYLADLFKRHPALHSFPPAFWQFARGLTPALGGLGRSWHKPSAAEGAHGCHVPRAVFAHLPPDVWKDDPAKAVMMAYHTELEAWQALHLAWEKWRGGSGV